MNRYLSLFFSYARCLTIPESLCFCFLLTSNSVIYKYIHTYIQTLSFLVHILNCDIRKRIFLVIYTRGLFFFLSFFENFIFIPMHATNSDGSFVCFLILSSFSVSLCHNDAFVVSNSCAISVHVSAFFKCICFEIVLACIFQRMI